MGLFNLFKKAEPENNPNSVFTLRFTIPYFQIFDKTDKALSAFPIKMSVGGSCQYRICDPTLCFDNVPLAKMSAQQLEGHVRDALTMNIKTFFNSISDIPLLQFESAISVISDSAKAKISPILNDEFGINLRAFSISSVRYDTEDPNYLTLQRYSRNIANKRADLAGKLEEDRIKREAKANNDALDILGTDFGNIDGDFKI